MGALKAAINKYPEYIDYYTPFAGGTWLHYAASDSNLEVVNCLLELGFDPNKSDNLDGGLPIVRASHRAHISIVLRLLQVGSHLDTLGEDTASNPLFAAIQGGSSEIVKVFLEAGIDTKRTYGEGNNIDSLAFAPLYGRTEIAKALALHNADNDFSYAEILMLKAIEAVKTLGDLQQVNVLPNS